jgi:hypothetical protein
MDIHGKLDQHNPPALGMGMGMGMALPLTLQSHYSHTTTDTDTSPYRCLTVLLYQQQASEYRSLVGRVRIKQ